MRKTAIIAAALAVSGCATVQSGAARVGNAICANKDAWVVSYTIMLQNAVFIENPVMQASVTAVANAGLASLAACPPEIVDAG